MRGELRVSAICRVFMQEQGNKKANAKIKGFFITDFNNKVGNTEIENTS
jgi:hypothetical protein